MYVMTITMTIYDSIGEDDGDTIDYCGDGDRRQGRHRTRVAY